MSIVIPPWIRALQKCDLSWNGRKAILTAISTPDYNVLIKNTAGVEKAVHRRSPDAVVIIEDGEEIAREESNLMATA